MLLTGPCYRICSKALLPFFYVGAKSTNDFFNMEVKVLLNNIISEHFVSQAF